MLRQISQQARLNMPLGSSDPASVGVLVLFFANDTPRYERAADEIAAGHQFQIVIMGLIAVNTFVVRRETRVTIRASPEDSRSMPIPLLRIERRSTQINNLLVRTLK